MAHNIDNKLITNNHNWFTWFLFYLFPLLLSLNSYMRNETEGIGTYNNCIDERKSYLAQDVLGICCVQHRAMYQQPHKDKLLIPYTDQIRVLWARTHSYSAVLVCLFLTPNLLFLFYYLLPTNNKLFLISARFANMAVYVFIIVTFVHLLMTFSDS